MQSPEDARRIAESLVERGIAAGATAADALYVGERSSGVQVRLGELENVSRSEGEQIGLRLFVGQRSATVASSDLSEEALAMLVERCLAMAREAPEDPYAGLAPAELLQRGELPVLDAVDPREPDPAELRARALEAENAALAVAGVTNSSGAGASASATTIALATSGGFSGAYRDQRARLFGQRSSPARARRCSATMPRTARGISTISNPPPRSAARPGSARSRVSIQRGQSPADIRCCSTRACRRACSAISPGRSRGAAIARKTSFLQDKLGGAVFADGVTIVDDPLRLRGLRSRPFDGEGVRVSRAGAGFGRRAQQLDRGKRVGAAARDRADRACGARRRRRAGRSPSNFYMEAGSRSREELLAAFPEAVLVIELIGQGVNPVTGDYSRGAVGFMVRGGEIAEPVSEITIASNLIDMFATLEPASDLEFRRGIDAPTILVPEMTVGAA